jgi:hypothetical protein
LDNHETVHFTGIRGPFSYQFSSNRDYMTTRKC